MGLPLLLCESRDYLLDENTVFLFFAEFLFKVATRREDKDFSCAELISDTLSIPLYFGSKLNFFILPSFET